MSSRFYDSVNMHLPLHSNVFFFYVLQQQDYCQYKDFFLEGVCLFFYFLFSFTPLFLPVIPVRPVRATRWGHQRRRVGRGVRREAPQHKEHFLKRLISPPPHPTPPPPPCYTSPLSTCHFEGITLRGITFRVSLRGCHSDPWTVSPFPLETNHNVSLFG